MSTQDLTPSMGNPAAYSDTALPISSLQPWSLMTLDPSAQMMQPPTYADYAGVQEYELPNLGTYTFWFDESSVVGYDVHGSGSSHQLRLTGSETQDVYRAILLRLACHFCVDLIRPSYLEDLLGNIRTTLSYQDEMESLPPRQPALPPALMQASVAMRYEPPPISFDEE